MIPACSEAPGAARSALPRVVFVGHGLERKGGSLLLQLHRQHWADRFELVLVTRDHVSPARNVTVINNGRCTLAA